MAELKKYTGIIMMPTIVTLSAPTIYEARLKIKQYSDSLQEDNTYLVDREKGDGDGSPFEYQPNLVTVLEGAPRRGKAK